MTRTTAVIVSGIPLYACLVYVLASGAVSLLRRLRGGPTPPDHQRWPRASA